MKLAEIRDLIEKATPGPWKTYSGDWRVVSHDNWPICGTSNALGHDEANAAFIAQMRSLAPKMLAVCEAVSRWDSLSNRIAGPEFDPDGPGDQTALERLLDERRQARAAMRKALAALEAHCRADRALNASRPEGSEGEG